MIQDAINNLRKDIEFLIEEYGIIHEHKSRVLLSLEAVDSLLSKQTRSRKRFPKTFSIKKGNFDIMEEKIEGVDNPPIFCTRIMHDIVVQSAINLQSDDKDFNRFTLLDAAQELNKRITTPAILVCIHYWMSMESPLLYKKDGSDLFALSYGPENFQDDAKRAWEILAECELRLEAPRGFIQ